MRTNFSTINCFTLGKFYRESTFPRKNECFETDNLRFPCPLPTPPPPEDFRQNLGFLLWGDLGLDCVGRGESCRGEGSSTRKFRTCGSTRPVCLVRG